MDFLIFAVVLLAIYFAPTIVAWGKPQVLSVFALNLLLGWSIVGWGIAMIWALYREDGKPRSVSGPRWRVPPGSYPHDRRDTRGPR
jgi:hypothetical protein